MFGFQPIAFNSGTSIPTCNNPPNFGTFIPIANVEGDSVNYDFNDDITGSPLDDATSWTFSGLPTGVTGNTVTGVASGTATTPGSYSVTVTAFNDCGSDELTFTWEVTPLAPPP